MDEQLKITGSPTSTALLGALEDMVDLRGLSESKLKYIKYITC